MAYERLLDKNSPPTEEGIAACLGQQIAECWSTLNRFIQTTYEVEPELKFGGKNYGWELSYRKGGHPLCDLYPENGAFTALVILGGKEAAAALNCLDAFGTNVRACVENTPAFHDGRWLWIRVQAARDVEDVEHLLTIKRKPSRNKTRA